MLLNKFESFLQSHQLTLKESKVTDLVVRGLSNKEISDKLNTTESTVKFILQNSYKKMRVESRAQLIIKCLPHLEFTQPICDLR